jgi:tetratricopeptide (TPR) repeat protein
MFRSQRLPLLLFCVAAAANVATLSAQDRRQGRVRVDHYVIDAEINPRTQSIAANVQATVVPLEDNQSAAVFELHNALNVSRVVDSEGRQIGVSRSQEDFSARLSFPYAAPKGKPLNLTFTYDGRLSGQEDSPVYGIKFASIQNEFAYLMYPARWFPVADYAAGRFSAEMRITVPSGFRVVASGIESTSKAPGSEKSVFTFQYKNASFPGSIAVVQGEGERVSSGGVNTTFFLRTVKDVAQPWGEEIGKAMTFFTSLYGLAPQSNMTVVETEAGTPNGYSAPGILFLSPRVLAKQASPKIVANQVARQWWETLVSPVTRNHMWMQNGLARYSELMYLENANGPNSIEGDIRDLFVEALTVEDPPIIQAGRLEDYSPEYWAATSGKGAATMHMLRYVIGEEAFKKTVKAVPERYAWKSIHTDDFRKVAEEMSGQDLRAFFIQWIESSGAPEFKLEYTVFRTTKGFRVMGKVSQDLDTFRMPVDVKIETEGNPEEKRIEVVGTSSEFIIETFGKPKNVIIDPLGRVLRFSNNMRVAVAIRKGEQFAEIGEYADALKEYQKALEVARNSSLAHYRVGELFFLQSNFQTAANSFREALNGDLEPKWTEVWAHINLGKIFDVTGQRERAVNEYKMALRTKDNTQNALEEAGKYSQTPYERKRREN